MRESLKCMHTVGSAGEEEEEEEGGEESVTGGRGHCALEYRQPLHSVCNFNELEMICVG